MHICHTDVTEILHICRSIACCLQRILFKFCSNKKKNVDKYYKGAGRGRSHQRELCHCVVKSPQIVASQKCCLCCFSGLIRSLAGDLCLQRILKARGAGKFTHARANNRSTAKTSASKRTKTMTLKTRSV